MAGGRNCHARRFTIFGKPGGKEEDGKGRKDWEVVEEEEEEEECGKGENIIRGIYIFFISKDSKEEKLHKKKKKERKRK